MPPYLSPPEPLPLIPRLLLKAVERRLGGELVANRILAWYPKALIGSGIMEALVAHDDREVPRRLLKLLRMHSSFLVSCPFCIDLNSKEFQGEGITEEEVLALRGLRDIAEVESFSAAERAALAYARCISRTPLSFEADTVEELKRRFSDRAIVVIASSCAQVNFWARLIQAFGVAPAGFSEGCSILELEAYGTRKGRGGEPEPPFSPPRSP
jgi:alkylhydroperoxidase family enzyme